MPAGSSRVHIHNNSYDKNKLHAIRHIHTRSKRMMDPTFMFITATMKDGKSARLSHF